MVQASTVVFLAGVATATFAVRYLLSKQQPESPESIEQRRPPREVTDDMVIIIQTLVPTASRDEIRRSLNETRSIELTTSQLLEKQQQQPQQSQEERRTNANGSLLDKYGVATESTSEKVPANKDAGNDLNDRASREKLLRERKQEMIRKARQRLLELESEK